MDFQTVNLMLGKSFLLNCIYARVCDRGLSAVRVTAFKLFESMRRQHMGDSEIPNMPTFS